MRNRCTPGMVNPPSNDSKCAAAVLQPRPIGRGDGLRRARGRNDDARHPDRFFSRGLHPNRSLPGWRSRLPGGRTQAQASLEARAGNAAAARRAFAAAAAAVDSSSGGAAVTEWAQFEMRRGSLPEACRLFQRACDLEPTMAAARQVASSAHPPRKGACSRPAVPTPSSSDPPVASTEHELLQAIEREEQWSALLALCSKGWAEARHWSATIAAAGSDWSAAQMLAAHRR